MIELIMSFRGKRRQERRCVRLRREESLTYTYLQMRFLTFVRNDSQSHSEGSDARSGAVSASGGKNLFLIPIFQ